MKQAAMGISKKTRTLVALLVFVFHTTTGASETWEAPQTLFTSSGNLSVCRVEFGTDSTWVTFLYEATPFTKLCIPSRIVAIDDMGVRHPVLSSSGVELDSIVWLSECGNLQFSITFSAILPTCNYLDILTQDNNGGLRIYGIHNRKEGNVSEKKREGVVAGNRFNVTNSDSDVIVIRGQVNPIERVGKQIGEITFPFLRDMSTGRSSTLLADDGTFSFACIGSHPVWSNMIIGHRFIQFYAYPGDTLQISINRWGYWNEEITYSSTSGNSCHEQLLLHGDYMEGPKAMDQLPWVEFRKKADSLLENGLALSDYLSARYHFTEYERHLLRNQMKLQYVYRVLFYLANVNAMHEIHPEMPMMIQEGDYRFLQVVDWADGSMLCTRGWTSSFCDFLLQVLLCEWDFKASFQDAYSQKLAIFMPDMHEVISQDFEKVYNEMQILRSECSK